MKATINRFIEMLEAILKFGADYPLVPVVARATVLYGLIQTLLASLNRVAADQQFGAGEFSGGTAERRSIADEILQVLKELAKTGQELPDELFPGVAEQFQVTGSRAYAPLRANLEAFIEAGGEYEAAFLERGYEETFLADLQALLVRFDAAALRRQSGRHGRRLGTVSLDELRRDGMKLVAELDGIISPRLRKTSPELLQVWKSAARVRRSPRYEDDAGSPPSPTVTPQPPVAS